jgi:DeoR/GlpR family transcriptional regulator of sugar metabolism
VSDMTIRRDLEILNGRGLLEKVHGGAAAIEGSPLFEPGFRVKSS